MNQDQEHLKLLTIFHYVTAGLTALFALIPVVHLIIGLVMVFSPEAFGPREQQPPPFFAWFFVIFPVLFITFGGVIAILIFSAGRCLAKRKHHLFCLVIAAVECVIFPFGTILGVFTLIVLMRDSVKNLFAENPPTANLCQINDTGCG